MAASFTSFQTGYENLQITMQALNRTIGKLKCRNRYAEDNLRSMHSKLDAVQKHKSSIDDANVQVVKDLEDVAFSLITSLKTFQLDAKGLIFNMHTKIQNMDNELNNTFSRLQKVKSKLDHSRSNLAEYRRITELKLHSMHCQYTNTVEEVVEQLKAKLTDEFTKSEKILYDRSDFLMKEMVAAYFVNAVDYILPISDFEDED